MRHKNRVFLATSLTVLSVILVYHDSEILPSSFRAHLGWSWIATVVAISCLLCAVPFSRRKPLITFFTNWLIEIAAIVCVIVAKELNPFSRHQEANLKMADSAAVIGEILHVRSIFFSCNK